jgi:hypothetical protein
MVAEQAEEMRISAAANAAERDFIAAPTIVRR